MRPGGFGLFGARRPRDPERNRKTAKILLIAGAVLAAATVVQFVLVSRNAGQPASATHACTIPSGARTGAGTPPGNIPKLVEPLGPPDASYTATAEGQISHVYCYNNITEEQAQAAVQYVERLGYQSVDAGSPVTSAGFTSDTAVPYGILIQVSDGLDLSHPGSGRGYLAITWVDSAPAGR